MAKSHGTPGTPPRGVPKWREPFLKVLASTGNVLLSCKAASVKRRTAYNHRAGFANFRQSWDDAIEEYADSLEAEATRRARAGTDKPVFYQGKQIATIKEYSDTLLVFLLKAARPAKFRDHYDMTKFVNDLRAGPLAAVVTLESALQRVYGRTIEVAALTGPGPGPESGPPGELPEDGA